MADYRDFHDTDGEREVAYGRSETSNSPERLVALHCDMIAPLITRSRQSLRPLSRNTPDCLLFKWQRAENRFECPQNDGCYSALFQTSRVKYSGSAGLEICPSNPASLQRRT